MKLICVCGATATGKTDIAFELAKKLKTEIISFDSVQVYKYFDIGTAKPSLAMRQEIPHHLVDSIEPTENFTAGDFKRKTESLISKMSGTKDFAILVGGTGFYLQALLKGMYDIPPASPEIKKGLAAELSEVGNQALHAELKKRDPTYASKIHVNDSYRILRGLEVLRSGSKTMTEYQTEFENKIFPHPLLMVGLHRTKLRLKELIKIRTKQMIEQGLIEETARLSRDFKKAKALESVGYKETLDFINSEITETDLPEAISKSTLLLAKRQTTWFSRDPQIHWFDPDNGSPLDAILELTKA